MSGLCVFTQVFATTNESTICSSVQERLVPFESWSSFTLKGIIVRINESVTNARLAFMSRFFVFLYLVLPGKKLWFIRKTPYAYMTFLERSQTRSVGIESKFRINIWRKNSCTCLDVNLYDVFEFILKKRLIVSILWAPFVYKFRPHQLYFLCVRNYSLFRGFFWSQRRIWEWVKVVEFNSHAVVKDKADMYLCCYNFS